MGTQGLDLLGATTLILFPGALGDAVCAEPAVRFLARQGGVEFRARGPAAEVAHLFPAVPRVASLDGPEVARLFAPRGTSPDLAWLEPFDRIVSFTGAAEPAVVARLEERGGSVQAFPARGGGGHMIDVFAGHVGERPGAVPRLVLPGPGPAIGEAQEPWLGLHPGASNATKCLPAAIWEALATKWRGDGGRVRVFLGPVERAMGSAWAAVADEVLAPHDVSELATGLASCAAFVGNDSGPGHVAAALGLPTVIGFTTSDPAAFGPRSARTAHVVCGAVDTPDRTVQRLRDALILTSREAGSTDST